MTVSDTVSDTVAHAQLGEQLCFALYSASKAVSGAYRPLLKEIGLSYTQYLVMLELWAGLPRTVSELGEALGLDSGTLSPLLKRMENSALILRQRSASDERVVLVVMTSKGRAMEGAAAAVRRSVETSTGLSNPEFVELRDSLKRLSTTLGLAPEAAHRSAVRR